jgi:hypothetical protein
LETDLPRRLLLPLSISARFIQGFRRSTRDPVPVYASQHHFEIPFSPLAALLSPGIPLCVKTLRKKVPIIVYIFFIFIIDKKKMIIVITGAAVILYELELRPTTWTSGIQFAMDEYHDP